ncbi:MAG: deoxyribose-phosphate aldolase [Erysipelotrichaceae bacterium]|nr:deoxyribose-phosphate aldolase [Erysipelotrichaceae bacterium]
MKKSKYIDHTLLKPASTKEQLVKLCAEAKEHDFRTVCVNPCWIPLCKKELAGTDVGVCTVIGFPLGAMSTTAKAYEAADAVKAGADEVDMVINIGMLKDHEDEYVINDIAEVKKAIGDTTLKVIIETCLLNEEEKVRACGLIEKAGAQFVKTSTGFSTGGATLEDVILLKKTVGDRLEVKAAGGVRTPADLDAMIEAGATRIGTSSGISLIK